MNEERYIDGKLFFSCKAMAERLGKTPTYVAKLCREGKLEGTKVKGAWFVSLPAPAGTASFLKPPQKKSVQKTMQQTAIATKPVQKTFLATKPVAKKIVTTNVSTVRKSAVRKQPVVAQNNASQVASFVRRVIATLPTKPPSLIPGVYVRSLPIAVGVMMSLGLFFVGTLPFMSESLATLTDAKDPFIELGATSVALQSRIVRKTSELAEYSSLAANVGFSSLATQLSTQVVEIKTFPRPTGAASRPSALARTLSQTDRIPVSHVATENLQLAATAALALYQFEVKDAQYSFTSTKDVSWGCLFGMESCVQKSLPVPLRGVTVYDIKTKQVHCLQVSSGVATSTPGHCDLENRE